MKLAALTDVGRKREHNEDNLLASCFVFTEDGWHRRVGLCMVSDGMGGAAAGEVAAKITVETVASGIHGGLLRVFSDRDRGFVNLERVVKEAIEGANDRVYEAARSNPLFAGMGATCCSGVFAGGMLTIGHVGDSRCYLFREGCLGLLTEDHSFVNELVREGRITAEQASRHPRRNVITRAIGSRMDVRVDIVVRSVLAGDIYLFCSDGLSGMIGDDEIAGVLRRLCGRPLLQPDLDETCRVLIEKANEAGGKDNISVVLAAVEHADVPSRMMRPFAIRPGKTLSWDEAVEGGFVDDGFVPVTKVSSHGR